MSSLRSALKSAIPIQQWRSLKALYSIREGYNAIRSINRSVESGDESRLYFDDNVFIYSPDRAVAASIFRAHFWQAELRREMSDFLALSKGCRALIDLGASGGVMSALFAQSRPDARILSIDPDKPSLEVLHNVREKNRGTSDWQIAEVAIGDHPGVLTFCSFGYGGEPSAVQVALPDRDTSQYGEQVSYDVTVTTLAQCAEEHAFVPDIIKIDIESFEVEVISQCLPFLQAHRPRIHLELHNWMIRRRGLDPQRVMEQLGSIGYREFTSGKSLHGIDVRPDGPLRIGLHIPG